MSWLTFWKSTPVPQEVLAAQSAMLGHVGNPDWPAISVDSFVRGGYGGHELVYACIRKIAESASDARMRQERGKGDETEEIDTGDVAFMLQSPNDIDTQFEFLSFIHTSLQVAGNAYIFRERVGRRVVNYWPVRPQDVGIIPGKRGPSAYVITDVDNVQRVVQPEDMGHLKMTSLGDRWFGLSPLQLSARIANLDSAAVDYARVFFKNAGVPRGLLQTKTRLDKQRADEIRREWRARFSGANAHDVGVLDEFATYQKIGSGLDEIVQADLLDMLETRICAVHGVPPILIGANVGLKRGTYSNYEEARESFWQETLLPLYRRIGEWMTKTMRQDFEMGDTRVGFDFAGVAALQENETEHVLAMKELANTAAIYIQAGYDPDSITMALQLPEGLVHTGRPPITVQAPEPESSPAVRSTKGLPERTLRQFDDIIEREFDDAVEDMVVVIERAFDQQVRTANGVMGQHIQAERERLPVKAEIPFNAESLIPLAADGELLTAMRPILLDVAARSWVALDGPQVLQAIAFDSEAPPIQQVLRSASGRVVDINATTRTKINSILKLGTERGYSLDQIARGVPGDQFPGVRSVIEETYKGRAKAIARTEVRTAQNMTTAARYRASGIEHVLLRDGDLDDKCASVNGSTVSVDWYMDNPTAHPNCTRGAVPVLELEGVMA